MRAVVQRVTSASICVGNETVSQIEAGLLVFLGITADDAQKDMEYIADKCINLRVFEDADDVMNLSVRDVGGDILLISQFTLCGDVRKGRRPSYIRAASPDLALDLYEQSVSVFQQKYENIKTGQFQAHMEVELKNDGPVTILLDSKKEF